MLRAVVGAALFLTVTGLLGRQPRRARAQHRRRHRDLRRADVRAARHHARSSRTAGATRIDPYLPLSAGTDILAIHPDPNALSAWTGFLLFLGYALAALAVSAVLLVRRDA